MSDISKCHGIACLKRDLCKRFTARPSSHWQSYLEPTRTGDGCEDYWPVFRPEGPGERSEPEQSTPGNP